MTFSTESMRETFGRTLVELGEKHENLVVLDADLNTSTRTVLFKQRFPDRFIQCGIAEGNLLALAGGLATLGFVAVPATFTAFATRKALDQIVMHVCAEKANVKIAGSYPGMTAAECGPSHNSVEDLAVMRALPHMRVVAPGDNADLAAFMREMVVYDGPVYFRVPRVERPAVLFDSDHRFQWGKGQVLKPGRDISLLGTGMMTAVALAAAEILAREGIQAEVVHMASIKPIDEALLVETAGRTGRVLTVENGRVYGGFGGAVAESLSRLRPTPVEMLGIGDVEVEGGPLEHLLTHYRLTPRDVAARACAFCGASSAKEAV